MRAGAVTTGRAVFQAHRGFFLFTAILAAKQLGLLALMWARPGPGAPLGFVAAAVFLAAITGAVQGRWRLGLMAAADLLLSLVLLSDLLYFRQFSDMTSVAALRFTGLLGTVSSSVTSLLRPGDALLFAELPLLLAAALLSPSRLAALTTPLRPRVALALGVAASLVLVSMPLLDSQRGKRHFASTRLAQRYGPVTYHLEDLAGFLQRTLFPGAPTAEEVALVRASLAERRRADAPGPSFGLARGKSLIVLQVESLHDYPLGLFVRGQEITPNLNRLAGESLRFTRLYHQTAQGVTSDAELAINCSLLPSRTGAAFYDFAGNEFRCLPRVLRDHGYSASVMHGMRASFWNRATMYPQLGFDHFFHAKEFTVDEKIGLGLTDRSFVRQVLGKLDALPKPYYSVLITLSSHGPFNFPELPRSLELGHFEGDTPGNYLQAVHYTDGAIGELIDGLRSSGKLDEVVLLVIGDHNAVYRGNHMVELTGIPLSDEVRWFQAEQEVAAMIRLPGAALTGTRDEPAGQIDLAPTLLHLLGIPLEGTAFLGRDLLGSAPRPVVMPGGEAVDSERILLSSGRCFPAAGGEELPAEACSELAAVAAREAELSSLILERNLLPQLLAAPAPAPAPPLVAAP